MANGKWSNLCKTTQFFHVVFLVECSLHKLPTIGFISVNDLWRACTAAIIAVAFDDEILEVRKKSTDLVRDHSKRMFPTVLIRRCWGRGKSTLWMLQYRDKHLN